MEKIDNFIKLLLSSEDIALIPYNPNPDPELVELFNHFQKVDKNIVYTAVLTKHNNLIDDKFIFVLNTIKHYKGLFDGFDSQIEFKLYQKIKPWLSVEARKKFRLHFYRDYGEALLKDEFFELDDGLLHLILTNDVQLFIKIANKMKIDDAARKIFDNDPLAVYDWLNVCDDVYAELNKLNEPKFIFQNMNGRLNSTDGALRYVLENTEPNKELFLSIKRNIGIEKFLRISNGKFDDAFYEEIIETLDDLIFVINTSDMKLNTLETILKTTKERFPSIYESLNSLLFMKKDFNNK